MRDTIGGTGTVDRFRVLVDQEPIDWQEAGEVFELDSKQLSWSRWKWSPAIPLDEYAGQTIQIRVEFDSNNTNQTVAKGIGISDKDVRKEMERLVDIARQQIEAES